MNIMGRLFAAPLLSRGTEKQKADIFAGEKNEEIHSTCQAIVASRSAAARTLCL
jgi:hypothetical protein